MAKITVIGAGMAGMACAARLQAQGHRVSVFEQNATWGGKLGQFTHENHVFDTGPSLFTLPAVYRDLFLKTGAPLEDSVELVDLSTAFRYQFSDGTVLEMPGVGIGACSDAIGDILGGTSAQEWRKFMQRAAQMWNATRTSFLESELHGLRTLLAMSWRLKDLQTIAPTKSLRTLARHHFTDPRMVTLVDRYATYTGSDPRQAPAVLATIPYMEQTFGTYHIRGGLRSLGQALFERCLQLGVEFTFQTGIDAIVGNETAKGVVTSAGQTILSDVVIANVDAQTVYTSLLSSPAQQMCRKEQQKIKRSTPSLAGFVMLLALRGKSPNLAHHNIWFPQNYDAEFDDIFGIQGRPHPVNDPTIYVCNPNDTAMSAPDCESWFVLINAPRHQPTIGVDWSDSALADHYKHHVLKLMQEKGVNITNRITWSHVRTPADLEAEVGAPGGSIYGTSSNGSMSAFLRPSNTSPLPGLYLVGGSAHPGGGLPLVAMSAQIVAKRIGRATA